MHLLITVLFVVAELAVISFVVSSLVSLWRAVVRDPHVMGEGRCKHENRGDIIDIYEDGSAKLKCEDCGAIILCDRDNWTLKC